MSTPFENSRDLADCTASELIGLYEAGEASPVEAVEACLARIDQQYGDKFKTVVKLMLDYN